MLIFKGLKYNKFTLVVFIMFTVGLTKVKYNIGSDYFFNYNNLIEAFFTPLSFIYIIGFVMECFTLNNVLFKDAKVLDAVMV